MALFEYGEKFIDKPIRLIELFAGYGSQAMALRNIGAKFEHHKVVEIDKYAIASYNAVHGTDFETTDICAVHGSDLNIVDRDIYEYLLVYSFPCQSISIAGKRDGFEEGSNTASSLLWEVKRILLELHDLNALPQTLLMENVKALIYKENAPLFQTWLNFLDNIGYKTCWKVLNTKDYGIPQNRERVFAISFLDKSRNYMWPDPISRKYELHDVLETDVDDSYYFKGENADKLILDLINRYDISDFQNIVNTVKDPDDEGGGQISPTITSHYSKTGVYKIGANIMPDVGVVEAIRGDSDE